MEVWQKSSSVGQNFHKYNMGYWGQAKFTFQTWENDPLSIANVQFRDSHGLYLLGPEIMISIRKHGEKELS